MATTRLSDIVEPSVYQSYKAVDTVELTEFWQSGAIVRNSEFDSKAGTGGKIVDMPFWNDLDAETNEPNLSSDNPASNATPEKITAGDMKARLAYLNNGWQSANLVAAIAGSDPMRRIAARTDSYWARQAQRRLIAMANGILADNVANDSSDMVEDVAIEDGNNAAASNLFSLDAFTNAAFTLGDHWKSTVAIAVHSAIQKQMVKTNAITFIKDSEGNLTVPTYQGRLVIVDDNMPVVAGGTSGVKYTSIMFGGGAFGYGAGTHPKPVAIETDEKAADGAGVETLWERVIWLMHVNGYSFESASVAATSASLAELANAANWDRKVDRKNVNLAYLITNG